MDIHVPSDLTSISPGTGQNYKLFNRTIDEVEAETEFMELEDRMEILEESMLDLNNRVDKLEEEGQKI